MENSTLSYLCCALMAALVLFAPAKARSQSSSENYIHTKEFTKSGPVLMNGSSSIETVQYFDGLGRPMQNISVGATPEGKDLVTPITYDAMGRQVLEYLPVPVSSGDGSYAENVEGSYYQGKYQTDVWYAEKVLEASPLGRILKQGAPGDDWAIGSGHEISYAYGTNTASEVTLYKLGTNGNLQKQGHYPASSLYKTTLTDENGHTTHEYKDNQGRTVLKSTMKGSNRTPTGVIIPNPDGQRTDTYYVYDVYGNLVAVVPPMAAKEGTMTVALQDDYCYLYRYDERNRVVEKKLPGREVEYMVYDRQDRLVAAQDGNLRKQGQWLFTKYDRFGRPVYTGLASGGSRTSVQAQADSFGQNNEARTTAPFNKNGHAVYYTQQAFPSSFSEVFSINYYDTYQSLGFTVPGSVMGEDRLRKTAQETKGLALATIVRVLGQNQWEETFMVYDHKSRLVGSYAQNHLGGHTNVESKLNFTGLPIQTRTLHKASAQAMEVEIEETFTYDDMLRPLAHTHRVNGGPEERLTVNEYDELGQVALKKVGGQSSSPLQQVDYAYNIRGWLTGINNISSLARNGQPQDLFAFQLNYGTVGSETHPDVQPLYNGNISETHWRTANDNIRRSYGYVYDPMDRLLDAHYHIPGSAVSGSYNEHLTYDDNGNILSLQRNGMEETEQYVLMIDDLDYEYEGNRLKNVTDGTAYSEGFEDGNVHGQTQKDDYEYDANGNMVRDRNKKIEEITYNHLNLPVKIIFEDSNKIEYLYLADGSKIQKKTMEGTQEHITDYLSGFQYLDGKLSFFPTAEGYVKATELEGDQMAYNYVYNYTDHLGNIRLRYTQDPEEPTGLRILEEDHYYPFGLKHKGYNSEHSIILPPIFGQGNKVVIVPISPDQNDVYRYKFGGKELQEGLGLDWYDFGARNYDAALGRWMNMDPLADAPANIGTSPYAYVWNNPLKFIDPDGRQGQTTIVGDNGNGTYTVKDWVDDGSTDVVLEDGTKVGESLTTHSFVDEKNNPVVGAVIDTHSNEGQNFIDNEIIADNPNVFHYKDNAELNEHYDFKSRGLPKDATDKEALVHRTRGSMTSDGKMASARDFGNMAAGIVAARAGAPHWYAKMKFNELQGGPEPPVSAKAQQIGLNMGDKLFWQDYRKREYKKATNPWPTGPKD